MGRIVVSQNVSLDGVIQDPTGEEGFERGGWFGRVSDRDREEWAALALVESFEAEALLLGRRSYEFFAARWPSRTGELADRLNNVSKHVVSSTLENPEWNNTTILAGDTVVQVSKLKQQISGTIVVYASGQLVRTLMEHDVVDELRLMIYPVLLGGGQRLFDDTSEPKSVRNVMARKIGDSLVALTYEFVRSS